MPSKKQEAEQPEANEGSLQTEDAKAPAGLPAKFKIKKRITVPHLKLTVDEPVYFQFTGKIYQGKAIAPKPGKDAQPAPMLARGIDLSSGEECEIILYAVVLAEMESEFPEHGYVGKSFELIKRRKVTGKDYSTFSIALLEEV